MSYAFGWDGSAFKYLNISGTPVSIRDQSYAEDVYAQILLSGVYTGGSSGGSSSSSSSSSSGGSSSGGSDSGSCVRFNRDLAGEDLQVWDSNDNPSCDFRGTITWSMAADRWWWIATMCRPETSLVPS